MAEYIERTDALAIVDLHHGPMLAYRKKLALGAEYLDGDTNG